MRIHKNRIWPSILLSVLLITAMLVMAVTYVAQTGIKSYEKECDEYDDSVNRVAEYIIDNINGLYGSINMYGSVLQSRDLNNKGETAQMLNMMNQEKRFNKLSVIHRDGSGYYSNGNDMTASDLVLDNVFNKKEAVFSDDNHSIIFANVINDNSAVIGSVNYIITPDEINRQLDDKDYKMYLLDEEDKVTLEYGDPDSKMFDYKKVPTNDFYVEGKFLTRARLMPDNFDVDMDVDDKVYSISNLWNLATESGDLWYVKGVIMPEDARAWKVVIADEAKIPKDTVDTVVNTTGLIGLFEVLLFFLWIVYVVTRKWYNVRLIKAAYIDTVTGDTNWNKFKLDSRKIIKRHKANKLALVTFDIQDFKIINDVIGHDKADKILKSISKVIRNQTGKKEISARYSADNFVMLIRYEDVDKLKSRVSKIDEQLMNKLKMPNIRIVYGIYQIQDYTDSIEHMVVLGFLAKSAVKKGTDNRFGYFDNETREKILREKKLEDLADKAFENHEFKVFLQPKYSTDGKEVKGAEALVRWISDELGFVSPGDFIPLFEKNLMINKLDLYMMREVCKLQSEWHKEGKKLIVISVNISRVHLSVPTLVDDITRIVDEYELPHDCIELELTESAFFDEKSVLLDTVKRFQANGFSVSMDDFGSGYSSLNSLKDLPLDVIKLDCEFFSEATDVRRGETIIKDTIAMAKHLNMEIVAEGIETKEQVDLLDNIGCDMIQGFYFARPMSVADFEKSVYNMEN